MKYTVCEEWERFGCLTDCGDPDSIDAFLEEVDACHPDQDLLGGRA